MRSVSMPRQRIVGVALLALALILLLIGPAKAADSPNSNALAAKAVPSVQLLETTYSGTVLAEVPTINEQAVAELTARLVKQAQNGVIGTSQASMIEALVDMIEQDPNRVIVTSNQTVSHPGTVTGVGTGWAITPDGDLITAAHVVKGSPDELANAMAKKELADASDAFVEGLAQSGTPFTEDQADRLTKVVLGWYARHLKVSDLKVSVAALIGERSGTGKTTRKVPATIVEAGEVYPGNDVALLKIDDVQHLPTVALGKDSDVEIGSTLHIVGFPAASTLAPSFSADTLAQPTVTEGPLTARKTTTDGMPVFQTQAPSSPGNSGGPVLDDNGAVIGVLVAGAVQDGQALEGQGYVIPVSEVEKLLVKNNVTPHTSPTTTAYDAAIDSYYLKHYSAAKKQFQLVEELYPQHPFLAEYLTKTDQAIAAGQDETPMGVGVWLLIGALLFLAALILLVLVLVIRHRNRRPRGFGGPGGGATVTGFEVPLVTSGWAPQQQQTWPQPQWQQPGTSAAPSGFGTSPVPPPPAPPAPPPPPPGPPQGQPWRF